VLGMIDVVLSTSLDPAQREQLETAQRSAWSLMTLLNHTLDLARIEAGAISLDKVEFEIRRVLEECMAEYEPDAAAKGIGLTVEIQSSVPQKLIGDSLRIRQVISQLLDNALKFTDKGSVSLRVSSDPIPGGL